MTNITSLAAHCAQAAHPRHCGPHFTGNVMNASNGRRHAIALLGALSLAANAAMAAAAGDTAVPARQSVTNASMSQRDALALLGVLMLAGGVAPTMAAGSSRLPSGSSNVSNPNGGTTLGVLLLLVAADGIRFPPRMAPEALDSTPAHKPMPERPVPKDGMIGIKLQLPCRVPEAHLERVAQLWPHAPQRRPYAMPGLACAGTSGVPMLPLPREAFRRHGPGNPLIHNY
jgi:hypothetical protein